MCMYHNVAIYFIQQFISKSYHFIYYKYLFLFKFSHSFKTFLYFYHSYTGANNVCYCLKYCHTIPTCPAGFVTNQNFSLGTDGEIESCKRYTREKYKTYG